MRTKQFLIVGQGLAGSLFAWRLSRAHYSFDIVDNETNNASKVAAGLVNPVSGMRLVKEYDLENLLSEAIPFYRELEAYFKQVFFIQRDMLRLLRNENELNRAKQRIADNAYDQLLARQLINSNGIKPVTCLHQKQTGFLKTEKILTCLKEFYIQHNSFISEQFQIEQCGIEKELVSWRGVAYEHLVFCEGAQVINNPYFNTILWSPVKGETLSLRMHSHIPQWLQRYIVNYGYWLLASNQYEFRTGATFERDTISETITDQAKLKLLNAIKDNISNLPMKVINHKAAIRLSTPDRQPVIGQHPRFNTLSIFNGFGSKGTLKIPYYSKCLLDALMHRKNIPNTVSIERFL